MAHDRMALRRRRQALPGDPGGGLQQSVRPLPVSDCSLRTCARTFANASRTRHLSCERTPARGKELARPPPSIACATKGGTMNIRMGAALFMLAGLVQSTVACGTEGAPEET